MFALVGMGSAYWMAQSKVTLKSASQSKSCSLLARETIEQFVSSGTRLYGYSYDASLSHLSHHPKFNPILLQYNTSKTNNYKDIRGGASLKFPDIIKNTILDQLKASITSSTGNGDWANTGVNLIRFDASGKIHLASSIFLINQVNVLQYLYNSDSGFFNGNSGKGKKFNMASHTKLKEYAQKYGLKDLSLYILIQPFNLQNNQVINSYTGIQCGQQEGTAYTSYTCPTNGSHRLILTRPLLAKNLQPASDVILYGNPYLGFQIKTTIEYQRLDSKGNNQDLSCDALQTFTHQMDTFKRTEPPPADDIQRVASAGSNNLKSPHKNRKTDGETDDDVLTSCGPDPNQSNKGSHGSDYNDITVEIDFAQIKTNERGTILLCQGRTGCRSGNSQASYNQNGVNCSPEEGTWSRCHRVKFPGQVGSTQAEMTADHQLKLTFNDLPDNRRFDLYVAELSTAGTLSQAKHVQSVRFYIDALRPSKVTSWQISNDEVGLPDDNKKGRTYKGPNTNWKIPGNAFTNKWIQCNQNDVELEATVDDQFTHNLDCEATGSRKDGSGQTSIPASNFTYQTPVGNTCKATLGSIQHGRQTIGIIQKDNCEKGVPGKNLVWDTDLPSTFEAKGFFDDSDDDATDGEIWVRTQTDYPIKTKVPAKTTAGKFPKHYSLDCQDQYIGSRTRDDGDGQPLTCTLSNPDSSDADGANPNDFDVKVYHVCGGDKCEGSKWAVYPPVAGPCKNILCESGYICCDDTQNDCGGVSHQQCQLDQWPHECDVPPCGSNSSGFSGCPPYGLYGCSYGNWTCSSAKDSHGHVLSKENCSCVEKFFCSSGHTKVGGGCKNNQTGKIKPLDKGCTVSKTWYCGDSDDSNPQCPKWPATHGCGGSSSCIRYEDVQVCKEYKKGKCTKYKNEQQCAEWEDPYPLYCSFSGTKGTCQEPSGSCSPRGRGNSDKTKEKATKRSVCSSHCNSTTHCCSGDSAPTNSNCP